MSTRRNAWDVIVAGLKQMGSDVVFGIPGDDLGVLHAAREHELTFVVAKDQRNAVFMAAGYALTARRLGVSVVGKGPALTNTLTGLLESASLAAPVLLIGTGTARDRVGTHAFQEADQIGLVKTVAKWSYRVERIERLAWALEKASFLALNDCPGPVYLEIPEDLAGDAPPDTPPLAPPPVLRSLPYARELDGALERIAGARKPLVLVGGGLLNTDANARENVIERIAQHLGAVVFCTASGRGAIDEAHPLFGGLAGLYTPVALRELWRDADVIVSLGSRLEETATMLLEPGAGGRVVVQVNVRADHFSHLYRGPRLLGDALGTARYWAERLANHAQTGSQHEWRERIAVLKRQAVHARDERLRTLRDAPAVSVAEILAGLERTLPVDGLVVQENGLLDMWSYFYPYFSFGPEQFSLAPSDQTSLGFGAAAALGVKAAAGNRTVVAFVGDGAFNIFGADVSTAVEYRLPVTYIVLNNGGFGWLDYQWRSQGKSDSPFRLDSGMARAHASLAMLTIQRRDEIDDVLRTAYAHNAQGKTAVIDVPLSLLDVAPGVGDFYGDPSAEASRAQLARETRNDR